MPEMEAHAWWADVQHLREAAERRQSAQPADGPVFAPLTLVDDDAPARGFTWDPSVAEDELEARTPARRFARRQRSAPSDEPELFVPAPAAVESARRREPAPRFDLDEVDFSPVRREGDPQGVRRTVTITGRPVSPAATPGLVEVQSRRPARRAVERIGPRPDRIAMWAVALGLLLCVVAMATASHP
jgi:hypothetical protein